ncbi:motility associated factor glycosyltransferase family protein [Candidatus Ponderosibacter sp. Uisw_141_02]|uniref:motility associated factor glycosyltransferase family protein n=1 Tax=Candidatus Ponderosibacter sp. Uisw_141_02 TaxID=3231000 RepID=UPI003D397257
MQAISDNKRQQIIDDLYQIDLDLKDINIDNREGNVRHLMDCRRQLLADLGTFPLNSEASTNYPSRFKYTPTTLITEQVKTWRSRVMRSKPDQQSFDNPDFCDQILDSVLPEIWSFHSDVMVIYAPPSGTMISKAIERSQRHIVIFDQHKCIDEDAFGHHLAANIVVCNTITNLEIAFAKLQTPAKQIITVPCSLDQKFIKETKSQLAEAIQKGKKNRIANTNTANRFGASWSKNLLQNLPIIANAPNLHQLSVKGVKDAVIVASGPSLDKNIRTLAMIQDQVFIVAALRSLQTLHDANIKPDLVIQLDAEDDHVAREFSTKLNIEIENFLVELTTNPWFLKSNAKKIIWSYPSIFDDISGCFGVPPTPFDAPSVAIYGLTLCYLLGFESLCFVGQDLASSHTSQYAEGATALLPAHNDISTFNIEVDGFYGDKVMTRSAYHGQLLRCEHIASELSLNAPHLRLFNATEGGAYIKGFEHVSLSEFVSTRNLINTDYVKQIIWKKNTPIRPTHVTNYLSQVSETMDRITTIANTIIKLDTATEKKENQDTEIDEMLQKFRCLNSTTPLLQIAMQEEISSVIGTANHMRDHSNLSEFFKNILRHATVLKSIAIEHGA